MRKSRFWVVLIALLLIFAAMTAIGLAVNIEELWGLGVAFLLLFIMAIPIFALRERRLRRYETSEAMARWTYSQLESDCVASDILFVQQKRTHWVVPLLTGCLVFMGAVFAMVVRNQFPDMPFERMLLLLLPAILPYLGMKLYRMRLRSVIVREPCETIIGRDFLVWGNTLPVLNERESVKVADAELTVSNGHSYIRVLYRSIGRMRYGKINFSDTVLLLVPMDQQDAARQLVSAIRSQAKDEGKK